MNWSTFFSTYGLEILGTILTALAGYFGIIIKNLCAKYLDNKTKQDVANTCVKAVEQIYKDIHGAEKLEKAMENAAAILTERGIAISDTELRMLIESALAEFNEAFSNSGVSSQS